MGGSQPIPTPTPFGELLRRWRREAGLSQGVLAERAGLSRNGVNSLERGVVRKVRRETVQLLADALQLDPQARAAFEAAARTSAYTSSPPPSRSALLPAVAHAARFVGRQQELARIERHLAASGHAAAALLFFTGEPGIGKSRLLHEAAGRAAMAGWRVLAGGCTRRSGQEPYTPFGDTLSRSIAQQSPTEQRAALQGCAWLVRLLPELLETAVVPAPSWSLPAEQERRLMFAAVAHYLANVAGPAGTLLLLDDLQWAGQDALDLLESLTRLSAQAVGGATDGEAAPNPLRLVVACRDNEVRPDHPFAMLIADLAREGLASIHRLEPLSRSEASELAQAVLENTQTEALADPHTGVDLATQLAERTGGHPFYLVSCAQALRSSFEEGAARSDISTLEIPWNVSASIRQRVAMLPSAAQELLGAAAIAGRRASRDMLMYVGAQLGIAHRQLLSALEAADQAHLLLADGSDGYRFAHDLVREMVAGDLSPARRATLHSWIGEALERQSEREREQRVAELAYHFSRTDQWDKALTYLIQAADRSHSAAARHEEAALIAEAIKLATRMQDHLDPLVIAQLHCRRGKALVAATRWAEARPEFEATVSGLPQEYAELRIEALIDLALAHYFMADAPGARPHAVEAYALANQVGRDDLAAAAMNALGLADGHDGKLRESQDKFRAAFVRAGSERHPSVLTGLDQYGINFYYFGQFEEALVYTRRALEVARDVHDTSIIVRALSNSGMTLTAMGRYMEALRIFDEARRLGREYHTLSWLGRAIAMHAGLHFALGDLRGAEVLTEEAREVNRAVQYPNVTASTGVDLLLTFARRHDVGRAEGLLEGVREDVRRALGGHGWLMTLRFAQAQAEVALARGAMNEALRFAEVSIAHARLRGRVKYEVLGMQTHAQALAALGHTKEAVAELEAAVTLARSAGDPAIFLRVGAVLLAIAGDDALLTEARLTVEQIAGHLPDDLRLIFLAAEPVQLVAHLSQ